MARTPLFQQVPKGRYFVAHHASGGISSGLHQQVPPGTTQAVGAPPTYPSRPKLVSLIFRATSRARKIAFVRLFRPMDVVDPPAALRANEGEARAVIPVVGAV